MQRIAQSFGDTQFWSHRFRNDNPEYSPRYDVYQSSDFPHVFLGGEDDLDEAEALAGQPMCKVIDCRDLPEIKGDAWDMATFAAVQHEFDSKVRDVIQKIQSNNCPIFVHCALGANRSVSVLAAALSQLTGKSLDQILSEMKQSRAFVGPQDPFYLMALNLSPKEKPEYKQQIFDQLNQDFPLDQPGLPTYTAQSEIPANFPDGLLHDLDLMHEKEQWRRAVSTPGSLVAHDDQGWTGKVVELRGDPVNGGVVLVEHEMPEGIDAGATVQRFYPAIYLSPVMKVVSPFRRATSWLKRLAQDEFYDWGWQSTEGDLDLEPFVQEFGETDNFYEAGYILPDGRMLNFGTGSGSRDRDHREIGGGTEGMREFMRRSHSVRFGLYDRGEAATLNFHAPLTNSQIRAINRVIPQLSFLAVDVRDREGNMILTEEARDRSSIIYLWMQAQEMSD